MEYNSTTVTVHIHKKQVCSSLATGRQADSVVGGGGGLSLTLSHVKANGTAKDNRVCAEI